MEYIISALWFALECVAFFLFASAFLPYRYNRKRTILMALCMCTLLLFSQSFPLPALVLRLCALIFGLCLIVFLFKGRLALRLFIGLLDYIIVAAMDAIVLFGASTILRISLDELVWKKGMYTVLVTAGKILSVFLAWLVTRLHPFHKLHPLRPKWMLLVSFFPLTSLFMLMALFLICRDQRDLTQPVAFFCIFLGIANVAIVYVVSLIEQDTEVKQQNNILSQQMEIQTASILALDKAYRQQRQTTHDFQNHLCTISDLLAQKSYETAAKYVRELSQAQTSRILIVNTHHPIIDAILNQKYQMAVESQIEMRFCINDLSGIQLSASELVVLLSNLLDNAIEACRRIDTERLNRCTILENDGSFLSIRNTSLPVLITEHGIATTKASASEHGYGLPSVCRILDGLHAELCIQLRRRLVSVHSGNPQQIRNIPTTRWFREV